MIDNNNVLKHMNQSESIILYISIYKI